MVLVTASAQDAQRLLGEMALFAPELRLALLPDWETLPYDAFSPHQDLISERLATLWSLQQRQLDVLIVAASTALYPLAPPAFLAAFTFHFSQGQTLNEAALKSQLTLAGYEGGAIMDRPKAILGLRPEHLTILDSPIDGQTFPATVEIDEPMGSDSLVWLEAEGKQISVRVPFEHRPQAGQKVHLKVDIAKASLFDETSEQRI